MTCDELRQLLGAFLDDDLSARQRVQLEEHLAACAECAAHTEEYRALPELLRRACEEEEREPLPEDLVQDLLRRVRPRPDDEPGPPPS
jgi:anti-sigma factor (TIGR02949 family)